MNKTRITIENGFAGVHEIQALYRSPLGVIMKLVLLKQIGNRTVKVEVGLQEGGLPAEYFIKHIDLARKRTGSKNQHGPTTIRGTGFDGMQELKFSYENLAFLKKIILGACNTAKKKRGNIISFIGEKVTIVPPTILGIVKTQ